MKPYRGALWLCAVVLLAAEASPLQAAWDNVFQVCCNNCGHQSAVSGYPPSPCPTPCPQQSCTTQYQARCYYQPVTTYESRTYYEPVTTYKTSYYYEPVTTYRTSCYYDPNSCSYKQVSCPETSYQLRSQSCPVQSWVQRCTTVPVQSYRQAYYWEPVTTCSTPPPCQTPCAQGSPPPGATGTGAPGINEQRSGGTPGLNEQRDGGPTSSIRNSPPGEPGQRQYVPHAQPSPASPSSTPASPAPGVKLDQIVALPPANVEGQVLRDETKPFAGAAVVFLSTDQKGLEQRTTANGTGQFRANLASGEWRVYISGSDGKLVYQRKIEVSDKTQMFTLVSR